MIETIHPLYIYGASGHAKVVVDIAEKMGCWSIRGIIDDRAELAGKLFMGYSILGGAEALHKLDPDRDFVFVAIGYNAVRLQIAQRLIEQGFRLPVVVHPSASIGRDVTIGMGTVVMAGVVINPATRIGNHCILNTGCTVDHDGVLGAAVHISPGAHLAGNVTIGNESWVGIGSSIIEGRTVGRRCIVGGGAALINDIPDDSTAVGVPARIVKAKSIQISSAISEA
jgi:sugar O-acyltransferase (sialic acid O-acetyltransferase NeuD family)